MGNWQWAMGEGNGQLAMGNWPEPCQQTGE